MALTALAERYDRIVRESRRPAKIPSEIKRATLALLLLFFRAREGGRMKRWFKSFWQILVGLTLGMFGLAWVAWGGSYNFYFNNTEQGSNSTATPTVTVTTDEKSKSGANSVPASETGTAPAAQTVTVPGSAPGPVSANTVAATEDSSKKSRRFRASATGLVMGRKAGGEKSVGGGLGFAYFPVREIGLNIYGFGMNGGGEDGVVGLDLEVLPLRFSLGRFENLIETGPILGASTFKRASGNLVTLHAGLRLNFNLGEQWSITSSARINMGYKMAEAGIAVHL